MGSDQRTAVIHCESGKRQRDTKACQVFDDCYSWFQVPNNKRNDRRSCKGIRRRTISSRVFVPMLSRWEAGERHTCSIAKDVGPNYQTITAGMVCWGDNTYGQATVPSLPQNTESWQVHIVCTCQSCVPLSPVTAEHDRLICVVDILVDTAPASCQVNVVCPLPYVSALSLLLLTCRCALS